MSDQINVGDYIELPKDDVEKAVELLFSEGYILGCTPHAEDVFAKILEPVCVGCLSKAGMNIKDQIIELLVSELNRMKEEGDAC